MLHELDVSELSIVQQFRGSQGKQYFFRYYFQGCQLLPHVMWPGDSVHRISVKNTSIHTEYSKHQNKQKFTALICNHGHACTHG